MNFMYLRNKVFILAVLFSGHLFAKDVTPALDNDKKEVLMKATDLSIDLYSETERNVLLAVAMIRKCSKAYPELKEKIEANFFSEKSGLDHKTSDEIKKLEASQDPYVIGKVDGALIVMDDKDVMGSACKSFAGMRL